MLFIFIKIRAVVGGILFTLILNLIFHCISSLHWSCMSSHSLKFEGSWLQIFKDSIRSSLSRLKMFFSPQVCSFCMSLLALVNK